MTRKKPPSSARALGAHLLTFALTLALALALVLALVVLAGCALGAERLDDNGKPTLDPTDHMDGEGDGDGDGKEDRFLGAPGLPLRADASATQVWEVRRAWGDVEPEAGVAWAEQSGLTWEQKYRRWVGSLPRAGHTFRLLTPHGRSLPAPSLECAEAAVFLRVAFASFYHLPFFMEARSDGERVFFGHFGIRTAAGRWRQTPEFRRFPDHEALAELVQAAPELWPRSEELRAQVLRGGSGDEQPAIGAGAGAGAYFDEVFLNKRVGHFLLYILTYTGSVNLADTANLFNLDPDAVAPGDVLVERWQRRGIGHTHVAVEARRLGDAIELELVSGSMPRRQPRWESPTGSRAVAVRDTAGGPGHGALGGGLKRWRSARVIGGRWVNAVPDEDAAAFVAWTGSAASLARIEGRTARFAELLVELPPGERIAALAAMVERSREHLRAHPSSCAARTRREETFAALYDAGAELGRSRLEIDRAHRRLEDYALAELVYPQARTCCWNSTTPAMYELVMELNRERVTGGSCEAAVLRARDDGGGGYELFRRFAQEVGRGAEWAPWRADESCPQAGVRSDQQAGTLASPLCAILPELLARE